MSVLSGFGSSALIWTARSTADVRLTTPDQAFDSDLYYGGSLLGDRSPATAAGSRDRPHSRFDRHGEAMGFDPPKLFKYSGE